MFRAHSTLILFAKFGCSRPNNQIVQYLNADEYQRLLTGAEEIRWYLCPVIKIAANTGLRRGNILELRWDECESPEIERVISLRLN